MDYNPREWRSTRMLRGFTYELHRPVDQIFENLTGVKYRLVDKRFYNHPSTWKGKNVWGWIKFREPLHIYDAMMAGLVPVFRDVITGGNR